MDEITPEILADNSDSTINSQQVKTLKKYFPQCFDKGGNFMSEKLNAIVSDSGTVFSQESYGLDWLGKSYARLLANEKPLTLLAEDKAHNQKPENKDSENLLIKGDNLEVLKHLKGAYSESIKMIYIDPPYNTGSDGFVYQDDRKFSPEKLAELAGIDKGEAKRILEFTQSKANSHSAWLTFMYPRLYIARELLKDDGVIFISIDENEVAQLKLLCNEVFGEQNFAGEIVWKNSSKNDQAYVSIQHEYYLVYVKSREVNKGEWLEKKKGLDQIYSAFKQLKKDNPGNWKEIHKLALSWFRQFPDSDPIKDSKHYNWMDKTGVYFASDISGPNHGQYVYDVFHPETKEVCKPPASGWRYPESEMLQRIEDDKVHFGEDHTTIPKNKTYLKDTEYQSLTSLRYADGRVASNALKNLLGGKDIFTNPKDVNILIDFMKAIGVSNGDIVLDFFAGSGTTAHAVMDLNKTDKGNRKFICVQLPEETQKTKAAYKAGYKTIFDITKTRIEKAANKIRTENPDYEGDLGAKVFETLPIFEGYLDNIETLQGENQELFDGTNLSNEDLESLLTTWQAYDGIPLTKSLIETKLAGYAAYRDDKVMYLMHKGFSTEALKAFLAKLDATQGDDKTFEVEKLVLFGYNMDSKNQLEISEAVRQYQNRKEKTVSVAVRY